MLSGLFEQMEELEGLGSDDLWVIEHHFWPGSGLAIRQRSLQGGLQIFCSQLTSPTDLDAKSCRSLTVAGQAFEVWI